MRVGRPTTCLRWILPLVALIPGVLLAGCGEAGERADVADFEGTWDFEANLEGVDDPFLFRTTLTEPTAGLVYIETPDPVPFTASIEGRTLVIETDPYESIRNPGAAAVLIARVRRDGEVQVGTVELAYARTDGRQVVRGEARGVRVP
jgi:hypothetical protein